MGDMFRGGIAAANSFDISARVMSDGECRDSRADVGKKRIIAREVNVVLNFSYEDLFVLSDIYLLLRNERFARERGRRRQHCSPIRAGSLFLQCRQQWYRHTDQPHRR